jgi:calcineurin-like phosphoesterase
MKQELKLLIFGVSTNLIGLALLAYESIWIAIGAYLFVFGNNVCSRLDNLRRLKEITEVLKPKNSSCKN